MSPKSKRTGRRPKMPSVGNMLVPPSMDRTLSDMRKLIESQAFDTTEEADAYIQQLLRDNHGQVPHVAPTTPLEQAMEVMYEAESEQSLHRRVALARKALEISPDCAAAYNVLAEAETDPHRMMQLLEQGRRRAVLAHR